MPKISSNNSQVFSLSLKVFSLKVFSNLNVKDQRLEFVTSYRKQQLQALAGLYNSSVAVFGWGAIFRLIFVILEFWPWQQYIVFQCISMSTFAQNWRCVTHKTSFLNAINCDWFAWCGSLLWLSCYCWMMSASLNHCKKMGAEPGRRFLKESAAKLEPVIVVFQNKKKTLSVSFLYSVLVSTSLPLFIGK